VLAEVYGPGGLAEGAGVKAHHQAQTSAPARSTTRRSRRGAITIIPEVQRTPADPSRLTRPPLRSPPRNVDAALAAKLPSSLTVLNPAPWAGTATRSAVTQATAAQVQAQSRSPTLKVGRVAVRYWAGPPEFKDPHGRRRRPEVRLRPDVQGLRPRSTSPARSPWPRWTRPARCRAGGTCSPPTPQINFRQASCRLTRPLRTFSAAQNVIPLVYKPRADPHDLPRR